MDRTIIDEFSHQAEAFNRSAVMSSAGTLGRLVEAVPAGAGERWLDVACGPGLVARALAPGTGSVVGVDLTPAMVEVGRREAEAAGLRNVSFAVGDATALEFGDGAFDGAVTRFSLHHIPMPGRVVAEMARVVKPGGAVVVADHVTSADADAAAWHEQIERLRDPSHWACLTPPRIAALGARAGLEQISQETFAFTLDFAEWLGRGSGGPGAAGLIAQSLAERPEQPPEFRLSADGTELQLSYCLTIWRRPKAA